VGDDTRRRPGGRDADLKFPRIRLRGMNPSLMIKCPRLDNYFNLIAMVKKIPLLLLVLGSPAGLFVLAISLHAASDPFRPTFASEVAVPDERTISPLLKLVCGNGFRTKTEDGKQIFGCGYDSIKETLISRGQPRQHLYPDIRWQADGILFGHFLSPESEDAVIGGSGPEETHPTLWGGTLLLTKERGIWRPVWYESGVITRHCRRISLANGRQILFCEETDGGMGHSIHGLYTVDLLNPKFVWKSTLLVADTYQSILIGGVQEQYIDRVAFEQDSQKQTIVRVYVRHGAIKLNVEDQDWIERDGYPQPKIRAYHIDFRLRDEAFTVTANSAAVARLFDVK
jgi:hypothetical protein